ncbi:hypothetical protein M153_7700017748 [Pseudoloma neurophilia]|uniref:Uncharacterized protein n=1 Tax=Pseudoloma neurophilia TaxID=146866 RepID=A0A0R0M5V4_9MICR|nr:hypothetical protein M153_7700017748 [Pseudoloma neurophilia]
MILILYLFRIIIATDDSNVDERLFPIEEEFLGELESDETLDGLESIFDYSNSDRDESQEQGEVSHQESQEQGEVSHQESQGHESDGEGLHQESQGQEPQEEVSHQQQELGPAVYTLTLEVTQDNKQIWVNIDDLLLTLAKSNIESKNINKTDLTEEQYESVYIEEFERLKKNELLNNWIGTLQLVAKQVIFYLEDNGGIKISQKVQIDNEQEIEQQPWFLKESDDRMRKLIEENERIKLEIKNMRKCFKGTSEIKKKLKGLEQFLKKAIDGKITDMDFKMGWIDAASTETSSSSETQSNFPSTSREVNSARSADFAKREESAQPLVLPPFSPTDMQLVLSYIEAENAEINKGRQREYKCLDFLREKLQTRETHLFEIEAFSSLDNMATALEGMTPVYNVERLKNNKLMATILEKIFSDSKNIFGCLKNIIFLREKLAIKIKMLTEAENRTIESDSKQIQTLLAEIDEFDFKKLQFMSYLLENKPLEQLKSDLYNLFANSPTVPLDKNDFLKSKRQALKRYTTLTTQMVEKIREFLETRKLVMKEPSITPEIVNQHLHLFMSVLLELTYIVPVE